MTSARQRQLMIESLSMWPTQLQAAKAFKRVPKHMLQCCGNSSSALYKMTNTCLSVWRWLLAHMSGACVRVHTSARMSCMHALSNAKPKQDLYSYAPLRAAAPRKGRTLARCCTLEACSALSESRHNRTCQLQRNIAAATSADDHCRCD